MVVVFNFSELLKKKKNGINSSYHKAQNYKFLSLVRPVVADDTRPV